ncbi:MAG TPA: protease inhibitor I9 family protein, partial [Thermoanaerobaculia bacterium]
MSRFRIGLTLIVILFTFSVLAGAATTSVIVELRDDPAAVAQAKSPMTADQIEAYRSQLRAKQDSFLASLLTKGVAFSVDGATVSGVRIDYRYTLVYNGVSLSVPAESIAAIEAMPQVKAVHPNEVLQPLLDRSVAYIRAPQVYGLIPELSQFDDWREGYEGQGMYISVIDTGIDHAHEMFGGDPTPPRLGVEPVVSLVNRNQKVVYYIPFADVIVEDGFGHGTHVASTAAGYQGFTPGPDGIPLN